MCEERKVVFLRPLIFDFPSAAQEISKYPAISHLHDPDANDGALHGLVESLKAEEAATQADCKRFAGLKSGAFTLTEAADALTERKGKLVDSEAIADEGTMRN